MTSDQSEQHRAPWTGAKDLALTVRCQGADHRLTMVGSELRLVDHPELDAELVLVALGGDEPPCVSLHHLWNEAVTDGGFVGEWVDETRMNPAWFSWLAMALDRMRAEGFHEFLRRLPPARAQRMGEFLHHMPLPWIDRAAAVVSEAVFEGPGVACEFAGPLLTNAIGNRLRRSFVDAVGGRQLAVGAAALVPLTMSTTTGHQVVVDGALRGQHRGVALTVGSTWLHRVWAVGAAVIEGQLVLALESESGAASEIDAESTSGAQPVASVVGWELNDAGDHRPVIKKRAVRHVDDRWTLA